MSVHYLERLTTDGGGPVQYPAYTVCTDSSDYLTQPCSSPVTVYSDQALTVPITIRRGDALGNIEFYIAAGTYRISIGAPFSPGYTYKVNLEDETSSSFTITPKSTNFSASVSNLYLVTTAASTIAATLPTAVGISGQSVILKKVDSGAGDCLIGTTSAQTIDGLSTYDLINQWQYVEVVSDGSNWQITSGN